MSEHKNPFPTVDIIIEVENGIVLIERKNPPHGWAIPGGFVDYGETVEEAAIREAEAATAAIAAGRYKGPLHGVPVAVKWSCMSSRTSSLPGAGGAAAPGEVRRSGALELEAQRVRAGGQLPR